MANFLDNLSEYNAKASLVISNTVAEGNTERANMMSSLKTTANDTTLSEEIRLNALTALINLGSLLDIPLPPYFPVVTTYPDTQVYVGVHNDLTGLQGGQAGEYYHLTEAQWTALGSAATAADISFDNLTGVYTDNESLVAGFAGKQDVISAPGPGTFFLKINGTTLSFDSNTYLSTISGIVAGGELSGTYPNPTLLNAAVIGKTLAGWNGSATYSAITSSDTILSGMQKLNARISQVIANPSGVSTVQAITNAPFLTVGPTNPTASAVTVSVNFNQQSANTFLAAPDGTNDDPSFRTIVNDDLPNSGASAGSYGSTSQIPVFTVNSKGIITSITTAVNAAGGQVNTVTMTAPSGSIFTATNAGTATDPVVGFTLQNQSANTVWAGPSSGASATPTFRSLVLDDIANISIPQSQIDGLEDTLSGFLTGSLAVNTMYIGNGSDAAVNAEASGDLSLVYVDDNGTNKAEFTIGPKAVSFDKVQDVTAQKLLGRYSLTNGEIEYITFDPSDFTLNSSTGVFGLVTPNPPTLTTKGDLLTSNGTSQVRLGIGANATIFMADTAATTGNKWVAMSGDVTIATSGATTIGASTVTLAKMANLAANSIIGNNTGSAAMPLALTGTQVTAMLDLFSTSTNVKGLVPGSNGNTTGYLLQRDRQLVAVPGTGTVTDVSVATTNGFAGTVNNPNTTPEIEIELDGLSGVLKGTGVGIAQAVEGTDYVSPGQITQTSGPGSGLTMITNKLLGRTTSGTAEIENIGVNSSLSLSSLTLGINLGNANTWTAQQQMPSIRLNGSTSGYVIIQPPAVAGTQTYTLPTTTPASGEFLTGTGGALSWATPAGSGTTTNAITFNNSGSGATSPTTFDGSVARTISYNTIGAQALSTNLTSLSGLTYVSGTPFVKMTASGTFALDLNSYVTNVSFTGGIISVATPSTTPAFTVAGNSGGVVYFSSGSAWGSSATLDQYELMMGGGAGSPPTTINNSSSVGAMLTSNGTSSAPSWTTATYPSTTSINRILFSSANNIVDQIVAPTTSNTFLKWDGSTFTWDTGGGGGGGGTVLSGDQYELAYYPATGTSVEGLGASGTSGYFLKSGGTAAAPSWQAPTGTGNVVLANSPSLVTPTLGAALATSINGLTISSTTGTLTLDNGSTLALSGAFSTTLTATAITTLTLPNTGTLATLAGTENLENKTLFAPKIGNNNNNGHFHMHSINAGAPAGITDYVTIFGDVSPKRVGFMFETDGFESYFQFNATSTDKTYAFPDADGTVALINASNYLSVPKSGTTSGGVVLQGGGSFNSNTVSFEAPATNTFTNQSYILPDAYPAASSGYYLTSTDSGTLSWNQITGGGDVVGPSGGVTDGDFAVFDGTTGKIIKKSAAASLTAAGRATFNSGVNIGAASSATGTLTFGHALSANTTTISQPSNATASLSYIWPTANGSNTNVLALQNASTGQLAWSATGTGDITRAGTNQIVTGSIAFNQSALIFRNIDATRTATLSLFATTGSAASYTVTLQQANGTVALLDSSGQQFSTTQTFTGGVTINTTALSVASAATFSASASSAASVTINPAANSSTTNPQLLISSNAGGTQWVGFGAGTQGAPTGRASTRSTATKISLYSPGNPSTSTDISIGSETVTIGGLSRNSMWLLADGVIRFYGFSAAANTIASLGQFEYTSSAITNTTAVAGLSLNLDLTGTTGSYTPLMLIQGGNTASSYNWISFGSNSFGAPVIGGGLRSVGTKIVISNKPGAVDAAIGVEGSSTTPELWLSSNGTMRFYASGLATASVAITSTTFNIAAGSAYQVAGTQVVRARETGYVAFNGTTNKGTSYATGTVTLIQLAERVAAIQASLTTHGLIGT